MPQDLNKVQTQVFSDWTGIFEHLLRGRDVCIAFYKKTEAEVKNIKINRPQKESKIQPSRDQKDRLIKPRREIN